MRIPVRTITSKVLELMFAAARDTHPNEFACALRAEEGVVTEILLVPGTISGGSSAILRLHMLPIDLSVVGSAHSHPSPNAIPSEADLSLFARFGPLHIIIGYPYDMDSWKAYYRDGTEIDLDVV
jgi:proteasome lid subunit RPN8/RPN11